MYDEDELKEDPAWGHKKDCSDYERDPGLNQSLSKECDEWEKSMYVKLPYPSDDRRMLGQPETIWVGPEPGNDDEETLPLVEKSVGKGIPSVDSDLLPA